MEPGKHNTYLPWQIETEITQQNERFCQSIFYQGNGRFGLRAALPGDTYTRENHGVYKGGGFEYIKGGITDMVNLPDPLLLDILIDSTHLSNVGSRQILDMKRGLVTRTWDTEEFSCTYERIVSFRHKDLVGHKFTLHAKKQLSLLVNDTIDDSVVNLPISDDQTVQNEESIVLLQECRSTWEEGIQTMEGSTIHGTLSFTYTKHLTSSVSGSESGNQKHYQTTLDQGETFICASVVSLEGYSRVGYDFTRLCSETEADLSLFWGEHDIILCGPVKDQCAIRWAIFMLKQNEPEAGCSIGARGLTHSRYKGCYFWDTEIFILPYYLYTDPLVAKNILSYRIRTFGQAKAYAASLNLKGARYPWMSALDGSEQCESWDTGKCEVHVTADVVWAMHQYALATGDQAYEQQAFAEIYRETARYWASRFTYQAETDRYEMLFVKGPNEYGGVTKNNTYTTCLALHTIKMALSAGDSELSLEERAEFEAICSKAVIPYSKEAGTYLEDDLFALMEPFDLKEHKQDGRPLYHTISFDRLQRYKVVKQPDVLLLYLLLPELFTEEEAHSAWTLYEPITSHDSTLSWGMHALIAYNLGLKQEAEQYLDKAMFLDLEELMGNTTGEGLHIGAMGAFLQAVLFGAMGLRFAEGITVSPALPASWQQVESKITYKGERYRVVCDAKGSRLEKISLTNADMRSILT
ncbi:MAG TPA: glycosyl hydrolase family 65 protein [Sphaerochaeta sp.]|nr:glycosyl hydrolase family 65 protein [Sphaerochaeta sp.]